MGTETLVRRLLSVRCERRPCQHDAAEGRRRRALRREELMDLEGGPVQQHGPLHRHGAGERLVHRRVTGNRWP